MKSLSIIMGLILFQNISIAQIQNKIASNGYLKVQIDLNQLEKIEKLYVKDDWHKYKVIYYPALTSYQMCNSEDSTLYPADTSKFSPKAIVCKEYPKSPTVNYFRLSKMDTMSFQAIYLPVLKNGTINFCISDLKQTNQCNPFLLFFNDTAFKYSIDSTHNYKILIKRR